MAREYDAFMQGIPLFSTVNLLINHEQPDDYRAADDTAAIDDSNGQTQKSANVEPDLDENLIDSDLNGGNSEPETDDENGEENNGDAQTSGSSSKKPQQKRKLLPNISKLDTCTIQVYPSLNPGHEYFRLPVSYMNYLNVNYKQTQDGLIIYGIDTVHAYEQILHEIIYFNRKPAYYLNRAFKLSCSELNGRFLSNDYIQTLTVIHPKVSTIGLSSEASDSEQQPSTKPQLNSLKQHANKQTEVRLLGERMKQQAKQLATAQKKQFIEKHLNENRRLDEIKNGPLNDGEAIKHQTPVQSRIQTHQHRVELKAAKVKSADFVDPSLIEDSFARAPASE